MAAQDTEQEPSIEEILSSIRQIISDDDDEPAPAPAPKPAPPKEILVEQKPAEEAIVLTNKVEDDFASMVNQVSEPEPEPAPMQVDMQDAEIDTFDEPEEVEEPEPAPPPSAASEETRDA